MAVDQARILIGAVEGEGELVISDSPTRPKATRRRLAKEMSSRAR
jgi:hypothetical protein